jgi:hypothetical protein
MSDSTNILADRHQESLFTSLVMLFEGRLGHNLYYPLGMHWYEEGFWDVFPSMDTARQYLSLDQLYKPTDGTLPLNQIIEKDDGVYLVESIDSGKPIKGISLDRFKRTKFDIIIASIPQHIEPFKKLIALYQPQAKLIYQIGNQWNIDSNSVKNILASAKVDMPSSINGVVYHQEFDLDTFHYSLPGHSRKIYSFINCLNIVNIYRKDWELFLELERLMPDWEFRSYGGQTRDGAIAPASKLADKMREATLIFHCKSDGDGYGHVVHNLAAVGRNPITRLSDYKGKLAEPLLEMSSIPVDDRSPEQIVQTIQYWHSEGGFLEAQSERIYKRFQEVVDFDAEEVKIRGFLENLK